MRASRGNSVREQAIDAGASSPAESAGAPEGPMAQELEDQDTARLIARFQAGETDLFQQLYQRYFDRVYGHLRLILNDEHEAEDVTQEVFLRVMRSLPGYELREEAPFRSWLFRIARNYSLNHLRDKGRLDPEDPSELERQLEDETPTLTALAWVTDTDLTTLIEHMPLAQRQVLTLRFMMGFSFNEIGQILGRSPGSARALQHRATEFLAKRLTALGRRPETARENTPSRAVFRPNPALRARRFALTRWS